jgi:hypothetical protein
LWELRRRVKGGESWGEKSAACVLAFAIAKVDSIAGLMRVLRRTMTRGRPIAPRRGDFSTILATRRSRELAVFAAYAGHRDCSASASWRSYESPSYAY